MAKKHTKKELMDQYPPFREILDLSTKINKEKNKEQDLIESVKKILKDLSEENVESFKDVQVIYEIDCMKDFLQKYLSTMIEHNLTQKVLFEELTTNLNKEVLTQ